MRLCILCVLSLFIFYTYHLWYTLYTGYSYFAGLPLLRLPWRTVTPAPCSPPDRALSS